MKRTLLQLSRVTSLMLLFALAGCGPKKKVVDRRDFQEVNDYVDKNFHAPGITAEKRRSYVVGKLGSPHRTTGETMYWYSPAVNCYYLQLGEDGWTSWGTGVTDDCSRYAVTP
jgi:predicted small lipoprotein YifL